MSESPSGFGCLGLPEPIVATVANLGYESASPVQAAAIPLLVEGHDVIAQAQTGTGKTAAFALPALARLQDDAILPQILILAPTRELAIQVAEACQAYARQLPDFHVVPIYGGQSYVPQLKALKRNPQAIVATPGRLLDHLKKGTIDLSELRTVVLDEADEMLRMGFIEDVESILAETPPDRQTALFSATMPPPIRRIANNYMRDPQTVSIQPKEATVDNIEQVFWPVHPRDKIDALSHLLEIEDYDGAIIFCRTRLGTVEVAEKLEARGYSAAALNGDVNQAMRERTINRLKSGKLDLIVATDVAARGIDVDRIDLVVNYDVPVDPESYVHRIGRTGRAGRTGKAVLFLTRRERRLLKAIERAIRGTIPQMPIPTGDQITEKRIGELRNVLAGLVANDDLSFYREVANRLSTELDATAEDLTAALLLLAQQERPLVLDQPVPQLDLGEDRPRRERSRREDRGGDRRDRGDAAGEQAVYRLEVGRRQGASPRNLVGALANEGGIDGRLIGSIRIFEQHSTIALPDNLSKSSLSALAKIQVGDGTLQIKRIGVAKPSHHKSRFRKEHPRSKPPEKRFRKKRHK
jgi:ATP-dependent RNA helicase DeaD